MSNKFLDTVIAIMLFFMAGNSVAQESNDTIAYSEEEERAGFTYPVKRWYRDFTQQMVEEKSMFKIGINDLFLSNNPFHTSFEDEIEEKLMVIMFGLGLEQKINVCWSILFEWRTSFEKYSYQWDNYEPGSVMGSNGREFNSPGQEYIERFNLNEFDIGSKYYFSMKRRMSLGECANNFSSNYLCFKYSYRAYLQDTYTYIWRNDRNVHSKILFGFGLQRRLSKYGFVDLFLGSSIIFYRAGNHVNIGYQLGENISFTPLHFGFNIGFGL